MVSSLSDPPIMWWDPNLLASWGWTPWWWGQSCFKCKVGWWWVDAHDGHEARYVATCCPWELKCSIMTIYSSSINRFIFGILSKMSIIDWNAKHFGQIIPFCSKIVWRIWFGSERMWVRIPSQPLLLAKEGLEEDLTHILRCRSSGHNRWAHEKVQFYILWFKSTTPLSPLDNIVDTSSPTFDLV